jgi:hypothetical protein
MGTFAENSTNIAELTEEEYCEGFAQNACENGGLRMTSANFNAILKRLEESIPEGVDVSGLEQSIADLQACCDAVGDLEDRVTDLENNGGGGTTPTDPVGLTLLATGFGQTISYDSGLVPGLTGGTGFGGTSQVEWTNSGDVVVGQTLASGAAGGNGAGYTNVSNQTTLTTHINQGQGDIFDLPWALFG